MTHPFSINEARGRMLFEELMNEALTDIAARDWSTETAQAPPIPHVGTTDTGTMRAVIVAS